MDEIRVSKIENVQCRKEGKTQSGALHLTTHNLIFTFDPRAEELWVPYPLISLVTRMPIALDGSSSLLIHLRNFRSLMLSLKESEANDVFETMRALTVASSVSQLYAFYYSPNPPFPTSNGWSLYSPKEEFARMGIGSRTRAWRFTDVNKDFTFCPTYPGTMVIPSRISDTTLQYASKHRSKYRIPALTYLHWASYATITRSSQPMVGITNSRSIQDEKLIEAIFQSHHVAETPKTTGPVYGATATNLIIDARPTTNAMANVAKGAGTENMEYYKDGKKAYLGIDNIHVMRDSLNRVIEALREADAITITDSVSVSKDQSSSVLDRQALRKSGWLRHLSAILDGTLLIVRNIHINSSHVLIHCSDGWDRTGQLSALSQLCLDPFYRTMKGFQILIEKDWLSFGHRFLDRCGHLSSEKFFVSAVDLPPSGGAEAVQALFASVQNKLTGQGHLKESSPVFHQFLECVRQIQRQYPERFEFNSRYLEQIHYHLYSCQFGTFLYNNEKDRRNGSNLIPSCEKTHSVWDFLNMPTELEKNANKAYDPSLDKLDSRNSRADMGVLFPDPKDVRFWNELYGRTDEDMNGKLPANDAQGAELLGPIHGKQDDPVLETCEFNSSDTVRTSVVHPILPTGISPSEPSSASPLTTARTPLSSRLHLLASSVPELSRRASDHSLRSHGGNLSPSPKQTERGPFSNSLYESPSRNHSDAQQPDVLPERMKTMWGKLSSNASAALTAVQDAYGGVTKELRGMAINRGWDSETQADELRSQARPRVPEGEEDWTSMIPSSSGHGPATPSWSPDTASPSGRWKTQSSSSKLSMLTLDNPWGTPEVQRQRPAHARTDDLLSTSSVWSRSEGTGEQAPTAPPPEQGARHKDSDPLGVL